MREVKESIIDNRARDGDAEKEAPQAKARVQEKERARTRAIEKESRSTREKRKEKDLVQERRARRSRLIPLEEGMGRRRTGTNEPSLERLG